MVYRAGWHCCKHRSRRWLTGTARWSVRSSMPGLAILKYIPSAATNQSRSRPTTRSSRRSSKWPSAGRCHNKPTRFRNKRILSMLTMLRWRAKYKSKWNISNNSIAISKLIWIKKKMLLLNWRKVSKIWSKYWNPKGPLNKLRGRKDKRKQK